MTTMLYTYKNCRYPEYLKHGNACAHILPVARQFCAGRGIDVGGIGEWVFPGAQAVNVLNPDGFHAQNLPAGTFDFIFSSHTLEHVPDYVGALSHWKTRLKNGGCVFLYLPHPDMEYWRPQNNRKHFHLFYPQDMAATLRDLGFVDVLHSERDMYWSFACVGFVS